MTKSAADWRILYKKDTEMVTLLNVRLKRLEVNSVSLCFLLLLLSRDYRRFYSGFVYFEWSDREHRASYFEFSLRRRRDLSWPWPTRHWPGTGRGSMRDHMSN